MGEGERREEGGIGRAVQRAEGRRADGHSQREEREQLAALARKGEAVGGAEGEEGGTGGGAVAGRRQADAHDEARRAQDARANGVEQLLPKRVFGEVGVRAEDKAAAEGRDQRREAERATPGVGARQQHVEGHV